MTEFQLANELNEEPYAGAKLVKTMVGMLPKCWSTDVRQLVHAVQAAKKEDDADYVLNAIVKLIGECHDPEVAPPVAAVAPGATLPCSARAGQISDGCTWFPHAAEECQERQEAG